MRRAREYERALQDVSITFSEGRTRSLERAKEAGKWLSVLPQARNDTVLGETEFRDNLLLRYRCTPTNLPKKCDGCDKSFSLQHALQCKLGGLILARRNEVRDALSLIASQAFLSSSVRDDPIVTTSRDEVSTQMGRGSKNITGKQAPVVAGDFDGDGLVGDLMIRNLWQRHTDSIIDLRVTDTDAALYISRPLIKVLEQQERDKKKKYLQACLAQRRHFYPFVVSAYGMVSPEAKMVMKQLARKLALKWKCPISQTQTYVNTTLSITLARATHRCMRGSRVPACWMSFRCLPFEDGAGLGLHRTAVD